MAKLFIGFDHRRGADAIVSGFNSTLSPAAWITDVFLPVGYYHNKGFATLNKSQAPPAIYTGTYGPGITGRSGGGGMGNNNGSGHGGTYTGATTVTRATWATAQGFQFAISRSETGFSGTELFLACELMVGSLALAADYTGYEPTNSWAKVFVWGDVEVCLKSATYISSNTYSVIFTVRNNGSEIATVSIPSFATLSTWLYLTLQVKLDATTGVIACTINGVAQSAVYTGQNTVVTTSAAAATAFYIGPPVLDNGTNAAVGGIDNVMLSDIGFPEGRITVATFALLADDSLTNAAAVGTSPTTVVNALSSVSDAKAAMIGTTAGAGFARLTQTPPTTTGYNENLVGIEMACKRVTNRHASLVKRLEVSVDNSAVETTALWARATNLLPGTNATPPDADSLSTHILEQIFDRTGTLFTKTQLATMKIVLRSTAP